MRRIVKVALGASLLAVGAVALLVPWLGSRRDAAGREARTVPRSERSVVLVTMDTTRADRLEPYGATEVATPALARLAEQGIVFERASAVAPITLVAHTSIHSGLLPPQTGVRNNGTDFVASEVETLAERFRERGYRTGAFVSAAVLDHRFGLDQGFELYDDDLSTGRARHPRMVADRPAEATVAASFAWLEQLGGEERFFLWVHFYDPHAAYSPPPPFRDDYRDRLYDGEIAYMDQQIGRLLAHPRLRRADPIVAVLADHGESLGEHGEQTHAILAYESTLRIPFLLRIPGGPAGLRVAERVSQIDVAPTILDLAAIAPGDGMRQESRGRSLVPLLEGARSGARAAATYSETYLPYYTYGWAKLKAIRTGNYKYIDAPEKELYDLKRDPHELTNLFRSEPDVAHDVERALGELLRELGDTEKEASLALDTEMEEQLRSLGYLSVGSKPRPVDGERPDPKKFIDLHVGLERARTLARDRFHAEAVKVLEGVLRRDPNNLAALVDLADALEREGRIEDAVRTVERALALDPGYVRLHLQMAGLEARRGNREKGLELLDGALRLDPGFREARALRAVVLQQLGRREEARGEIDGVLASEPDDPRFLALRVQFVELPENDLSGAQERLERALRRDPFFVSAWRLLGETHERAKRVDEAIAAYRSGLERQPDDADLHARLGLLLARHRRGTEAELHLREASRLSEERRSEVDSALGALLAEQGRLDEAQREYQKVLDRDATHPGARNNRAIALWRTGKVAEAKRELELLIAEFPRHADALNNLSAIALAELDWPAAEGFARRAIERAPEMPEAWNNLGIAQEERGALAAASASYREALRFEPDYDQARFNLGGVLEKQGQPAAAAAEYQLVLDANPSAAPAHLRMGLLYAEALADPARATRHLNAFLRLVPSGEEAARARSALAAMPAKGAS